MGESATGVQDARQKRYARQSFAAICIMIVTWTGIQWSCMNLYAAPVTAELGISRTQFMLSLSIPSLISAFVSLLAYGTIESRVGIRRMMLIAGVLDTLAFLCWALMHSLVLLYVGATLYGFGVTLVGYNTVSAGVNRWFKQRMGSLVGVANTMANAAGIVFSLVIAWFIASIGWRYSFLASAGVSAVATVVCFALYKGNPEDVGVRPMYADAPEGDGQTGGAQGGAQAAGAAFQEEGVPFLDALRTLRMWMLALGFLLLGMATYALMSTLPLFAVDLGYSGLQGQVVSVSLLACAVMLVPLGMICDRFGTRWGIFLCCAFTLVAAVLLCLPQLPVAGMMLAAVCVGAGYSACSTTAGVGAKETFGDVDFSKKLGIFSGLMYIGFAIGPAAANSAYDATGTYFAVLLVIAALSAGIAVLFLVFLRRAY